MSWSGCGEGDDGYSVGFIYESSRPCNSPSLLHYERDEGDRYYNGNDDSFLSGRVEVCSDRRPTQPVRDTSLRTSATRTVTMTEVDRADEVRKCLAIPTFSQYPYVDSPFKPVHSFVRPPRFPVRKTSKGYPLEREDPSTVRRVEDGHLDDSCDSYFGNDNPCRSRGVPPGEMCAAPSDVLIQVAPGVRVPLRSGAETWQAIVDDFYVPSSCAGCSETLFVIQDAAYVLCPECRTISPMAGQFINQFVAGAGMGFTFEDLSRWQNDIMLEQTGR